MVNDGRNVRVLKLSLNFPAKNFGLLFLNPASMSGICSSPTASALLAAGWAELGSPLVKDRAAVSFRFCRLMLLFLGLL